MAGVAPEEVLVLREMKRAVCVPPDREVTYPASEWQGTQLVLEVELYDSAVEGVRLSRSPYPPIPVPR